MGIIICQVQDFFGFFEFSFLNILNVLNFDRESTFKYKSLQNIKNNAKISHMCYYRSCQIFLI